MASEDIKTLKFPDNIRTRPGAYIGSVEDASNIFREIIDNAIDEAYRSKSMHNIDIKRIDDTYIISDDGRGIPVKKSTLDSKETMTYESLTNLNSGSKFEVNSEVSIGLNGLGTKATNALSDVYIVHSKMSLHNINEMPERLKKMYKGEKYYYLKFQRGKRVDEGFDNYKSDYSTIVEFTPDASIFESVEASIPDELPYVQYIIEHKYNKKLNIIVNGTPYQDTLKPYSTEFILSDEKFSMMCGIEMLNRYDPGIIEGSVNGLICSKGWHVRNFNKALVKAMNILWNTDYSSDDILYGLKVRVIFLFGGNLNYTAQIKDTLASVEGYPSKGEQIADQLMPDVLKYLKKDRRYWEGHKKRIESLLDAKKKIDRENLVKETFFKKKVMPTKLVDCSSSNRRDTELFIVEGNSAASSLVQARNAKIHAILPLRGKMLNTVGMPIEDVLKNQECENFIRAIGCGTKDHFVKNKFRYGKIVIASDADSDGCFLGSERVRLLDDTCPTFEELVKMENENPGREYEVFSVNNEGNVVPAKAYKPRITRYVDKLCKVTLDNGKVITCTIDHQFLSTDMRYIEAEDLEVGESLNAIYFKNTLDNRLQYKGHLDDKFKNVHTLVNTYYHKDDREILSKEGYEKGYSRNDLILVTHHIDCNRRNNSSDNLKWMLWKDHSIYHSKWGHVTGKITGTRNITKYNKSEKHREDARKRGKITGPYYLTMYNKSESHKDFVVKMNKDESIKKLQIYSRLIKAAKSCEILTGLNYSEILKDQYSYRLKYKLVPSESTLSRIFDSMDDFYDRLNNYTMTKEEAELYQKVDSISKIKSENNKLLKRSMISRVINQLLFEGLDFNEKNYENIKYKLYKRCTGYRAILKYFNSYDEALEYAKSYNHKVSNVEIINLNEEIPVYCMTVPKYENFMLDTSNKNDISGVIVHNCHIRNLVLGLIFDHCPELINMGVVYILCSPLFKVGDQYIYTDTLKGVNTRGKSVERFKGLGSLRKDDMAEIAFGRNRKLMQVTMNNNDSIYATQLMTSSSKKGELLIKEGVIEV